MSNALFWSNSPLTRPVTGSLHFTIYREGTGFLAVKAFSGRPCAGQGQSAPEAWLPKAGADDTPSPARHRNLLFQCQFSERNLRATEGSLSGAFPRRLYLLLSDLHVQDDVVNQLRQGFLHGAFEFTIF